MLLSIFSCRLQRSAFTLKDSSDRSGITHIPSSTELKKELMSEFKRSKKPTKLETDFNNTIKNGSNSNNCLFLVPPAFGDAIVDVEFVCVCLSPPVSVNGRETGSGYRYVEGKLELQLIPSVSNTNRPGKVLSSFEKQVRVESPSYFFAVNCYPFINAIGCSRS